RALIKTLIGEGKTYKEVQKMIGCSAKLISNASKAWKAKLERLGRKRKTTIRMDRRIARMAKIQPMIKFAKEHIDWPKEKWRKILWTDESKIVLFGNTCEG
uniref:Transposase n=1 Tax=Dicentrarchus labrax TaxID=13489 RepID=A0A8C4H2B7_DICLA